jgi:hypothetical protein
MTDAIRQLIEAIHHAPHKCVLAVTGGGTSAAAQLLSVPGASRTVLEVLVPYHEHSLVAFLGRRPEQFCSLPTSQEMARRALERARWLAPGEPVVGVGCTATLATDRPKRGDHRFHLTTQDRLRSTSYSLILNKGARDREGEEALLDVILLNALTEAFGLDRKLPVPLLPGEQVQVEVHSSPHVAARFLRGELATVCVECDGRMTAEGASPRLILPGSFNPLHEGHLDLAGVAARLNGTAPAFELSVTNVDKPPLPPEEIERRLGQFQWRAPVWLTRAPTFREKASVFPGACFVVGADTAARIVDPRYYHDSAEEMTAALDHIRAQGCRFLVAGRAMPGGPFVGLDDLGISVGRDLFTAIAEAEFRRDVSSTELRRERIAEPRP